MTSADPHLVRLACQDDREDVFALLTRAFVAEPALRHLFPADDDYTAGAPEMFSHLFDKRVAYGSIWLTAVDGGLGSAALWSPPRSRRSCSDLEREAEIDRSLLRSIDRGAAARLSAHNEKAAGLLPDRDHWYLGVLGVELRHGRRGLARAVMDSGREATRADDLPCALETSNTSNVLYYKRAGWRLHASAGGPYPIWVFVDALPAG